MNDTQELIKLAVEIYDSMERFRTSLIDKFNKNTERLCKYWKKSNMKPEIFMNWECNHPKADRDWADTDNCGIGCCPDEKEMSQPAGKMAAILTGLGPIHEKLVGALFNEGLSKACVYNNKLDSPSCKHDGNEVKHCCIAACPLRVDPGQKYR